MYITLALNLLYYIFFYSIFDIIFEVREQVVIPSCYDYRYAGCVVAWTKNPKLEVVASLIVANNVSIPR